MSEWFEDCFGEDYFTIYEGAFPDEVTNRQVDGIIELLELEPGAHILDLASGHGRHSLELARRGYQVTGYDLSKTFLDRAAQAAKEEDLDISFIQGDMRELSSEERFDAVINIFTAFGYFADERDDLEVVRRICGALKPGGRFLIETLFRDGLPARFSPSNVTRTSDGKLLLHERTWNLDTDLMDDDVTIIYPDGSRKSYVTQVRMRTLKQFIELFREGGLEPESWYGGLHGAPLTLQSYRLVIVSRRP